MDERISIGKAAGLLGVSVDTLRRWDASGAFVAERSPSGRRYYPMTRVLNFRTNFVHAAEEWQQSNAPIIADAEFYCDSQPLFQTRLTKMEMLFVNAAAPLPWYSLIVAAVGEIGNNAFDHNIGNWRDVPGIYFGYQLARRAIVIADRGRGVLQTLQQVRPHIADDAEALRIAFTEIVSGRAPEARGNGLKYVRRITVQYPLVVDFTSGNSRVHVANGNIRIDSVDSPIRGCVALITYNA